MLAASLLLAPAAHGQGWEAGLPAIAPALRACLDGRPGAMVVDVREAGQGRLDARLLLPGGGQEACAVSADGMRVESRRPVDPAAARSGGMLRAFMSERRCADARRVEDAAGRELGWLAYPGCG